VFWLCRKFEVPKQTVVYFVVKMKFIVYFVAHEVLTEKYATKFVGEMSSGRG
jgi:hypothetical protein